MSQLRQSSNIGAQAGQRSGRAHETSSRDARRRGSPGGVAAARTTGALSRTASRQPLVQARADPVVNPGPLAAEDGPVSTTPELGWALGTNLGAGEMVQCKKSPDAGSDGARDNDGDHDHDTDGDHDHDHEHADVALLRPHVEMALEVSKEVYLFHCAKLILDWARDSGRESFGPPDLPASELKKAFRKLWKQWDESLEVLVTRKGQKMTGAEAPDFDYQSTLGDSLALLVYYGAISGPHATVPYLVLGAALPEPVLDKLAELEEFRDELLAITTDGSLGTEVVPTALAPKEWSSSDSAVADEETAHATLVASEADFNARMAEYIVIYTSVKGATKVIKRALKPAATLTQGDQDGTVTWAMAVAERAEPVLFTGDIEAIENVETGEHPETVAYRDKLYDGLKSDIIDHEQSTRYRTYSEPVLAFLEQLRTRNDAWTVGTYNGHSWSTFSADIYLDDNEKSSGFFEPEAAFAFIDAVNETAVAGVDGQPYEWKVVYGDERVGREIKSTYGSKYFSWSVPGHGPDKDYKLALADLKADDRFDGRDGDMVEVDGYKDMKPVENDGGTEMVVLASKSSPTHIHLNLRPSGSLREQAGYRMDGDRAVLSSWDE